VNGRPKLSGIAALLAAPLLWALPGCAGARNAWMFYSPPPAPTPLGTHVDQANRIQEDNSEAAKFIVYQHEFKLNELVDGQNVGGFRLNEDGEDHVRKIAEQLRHGVMYPVVVERSRSTAWPDTRFEYPVHFDAELDLKRRAVVVQSLTMLGVPDADQRVVVAPAFPQGYTSGEAAAAYNNSLRGGLGGSGGGGFGGGGFGGGGFF
jgi:hypothetical protein